MASPRFFIPALMVLMIMVPLGLVWAVQANGVPAPVPDEPIAVQTDGRDFERGETVRIWIRNVGARTLEGSPRLLVLNNDGNVVQTFSFARFIVQLEPGESVWVDWAMGPRPHPCYYGTTDAAGSVEPSRAYPCPAVAESQDMAGEGGALGMCYPCTPPGPAGSFILVGIFGEHADAHSIRLT